MIHLHTINVEKKTSGNKCTFNEFYTTLFVNLMCSHECV